MVLYRYATLGLLALILASVWVAPAPYLHDFGEWLYQSRILTLRFTDPQAVTAFQWASYPVPNSLSIVLLAMLGAVLPALLAGKVYLSCLLVGWLVAIDQFIARIDRCNAHQPLRFVLFAVLALSPFFWTGFIGYQLGLLLLALFLGRFSRQTGPWEIGLFAVLIFLAHAMPFLVLLLVVLAHAAATGRWRSPLLALVPAAVLSAWFVVGRELTGFEAPVADAAMAGWRETLLYKLGYPLMLGPFRNILQPDMSSLLDAWPWLYRAAVLANAGVVVSLVVYSLAVLWRSGDGAPGQVAAASHPGMRLAAWLLLAFYVVAPYNFHGLINPAARIAIPLFLTALLLSGGASMTERLHRLLRFVAPATLLLTSLTAATYLTLMIRAADPDYLAARPRHSGKPPRDSVFAYNAWLYGAARYKYFNYPVFAFSGRFREISEDRYPDLGFTTGLLVGHHQPH